MADDPNTLSELPPGSLRDDIRGDEPPTSTDAPESPDLLPDPGGEPLPE